MYLIKVGLISHFVDGEANPEVEVIVYKILESTKTHLFVESDKGLKEKVSKISLERPVLLVNFSHIESYHYYLIEDIKLLDKEQIIHLTKSSLMNELNRKLLVLSNHMKDIEKSNLLGFW